MKKEAKYIIVFYTKTENNIEQNTIKIKGGNKLTIKQIIGGYTFHSGYDTMRYMKASLDALKEGQEAIITLNTINDMYFWVKVLIENVVL